MAEPHPDMNIKVAALTVSEKSSNTSEYASCRDIKDCANMQTRLSHRWPPRLMANSVHYMSFAYLRT